MLLAVSQHRLKPLNCFQNNAVLADQVGEATLYSEEALFESRRNTALLTKLCRVCPLPSGKAAVGPRLGLHRSLTDPLQIALSFDVLETDSDKTKTQALCSCLVDKRVHSSRVTVRRSTSAKLATRSPPKYTQVRKQLQFHNHNHNHNHRCSLCCSVPPGYVYPSPYLTATPSGIVPLPPAPVSHAAALAAAAAATSQFYEYQNAAAAAAVTYPGQYPNGFETYPYTSAAGKPFSCSPPLDDRPEHDNRKGGCIWSGAEGVDYSGI